MSGWSNEETLSFLEFYQIETCIWNPKDKNHKDKKKQADAWIRLAELTGKPVKELKNKKEILMTTFRKHLKKKRESMHSGAGAEEIYNPTWFAFETMESFLLPVYTCNEGINTESQSQQIEEEETVINQVDDDPLTTERASTVITPPRPPSASQSIQAVTNKRRRPASDTAEKQMAAAFGQLTNVLGQSQKENRPIKTDDDCDLYAKLLAIKLRELLNEERKMMMYQIDGLLINRINLRSHERHTQYPQYFARPTSMASAYSHHSRPTSADSVYSEPIHNTPTFFPSPSTETSHSATEHILTLVAPAPSTSTASSHERHTPSPQYFARPSSMASAYSHHSRPTSADSVYSKPIHNTQTFFPSPSTQTSQSATEHVLTPAPSTSTASSNIINMAILQAFEDFESSK